MNNNYIAIFIICIILYNIFVINKTKYHKKYKDNKKDHKKDHKKNKDNKKNYKKVKDHKKDHKKINQKEINQKEINQKEIDEINNYKKKEIDEKKKFVIKQLIQLKNSLKYTNNITDKIILDISSIPIINEQIHLISAISTNKDEKNFTEQFKSFSKKLYSINENDIKNSDIIKTNFIDNINNIVSAPISINNYEITGIINAPMYAPIESINNLPLDIFLINQINTTKNNSVSFLDQPLETLKNKCIKSKIEINTENINNIIGYELDNKHDLV